ncbi:MAG: hypothetical protein KGZ39_06820 [Simkania sp.]|nr:hypothetical protein [Simkania sp.]
MDSYKVVKKNFHLSLSLSFIIENGLLLGFFTHLKRLLILFPILSFGGLLLIYNKKHRSLLIVGCARSGTTYIAKRLQKSGLQIGHEHVPSHCSQC